MFEVIHHTDTVKPEAWVVFANRNGKLERAVHLGRRGGFKTKAEADQAVLNATKYGTQNV